MFDNQVRTPNADDIEQVEKWRRLFREADLEVPNGYSGDGVATAVSVTPDGALTGALTGTMVLAVSLDPFVKNPEAPSGDVLAALFALTNALEYQASLCGAVDAYIAIPNLLPQYQQFVEKKCGFEQTAQACRIYRRCIARSSVPSPVGFSPAEQGGESVSAT